MDFGAARDGVPESKRGHRIVVDAEGAELDPDSMIMPESDDPPVHVDEG